MKLAKRGALALLFASCLSIEAAESALSFSDPKPQRYQLSARASQLDPRAREHAEIDFVFTKQGKPADAEHVTVDARVTPRGRLVIWLMGHSPALFDRLSEYGVHAVQVHYANGWLGKLSKLAPPKVIRRD